MLLPASPPRHCPPHCRCTAHRAAHLTAAVLPASPLPPRCPPCHRCTAHLAATALPTSLPPRCPPHCRHAARLAATTLPALPPQRCSSCHPVLLLPMSRRCSSCRHRAVAP